MSETSTGIAKKRPVWLIPVVIVGVLLLASVLSYNGLVKKRNAVDQQFSQISVQLERRYALIPNIVSSVKGGQQQERDVIQAIADARTRYAGAQSPDAKVAASNSLESSLGRLLVISEQYPDLKSNALLQDLITQLEGSENRISQERRGYNQVVTEYNNSVQTFPRSIFAAIFGFDKRDLFTANPAAQNAPTVDFSTPTTASGNR